MTRPYARGVMTRRVFEIRAALVATGLAVALLVGWSAARADAGKPSAGPSLPARATPQGIVKVFFVKGDQFAPRARAAPTGKPPAKLALQTLLAGPTASERAAGIDTTLPRGTKLASIRVTAGLAKVDLTAARRASTAADVALRPARAAQIVYTLTATPGVKEVLIRVNGVDRATFIGAKLAVRGPLDKHDLSKPITLSKQPTSVPKGPAPPDARGVQRRLATLRYFSPDAITGTWNDRTRQAVIAFQAWHRLARDGVVGAQTLAALENARPPRPAASTTRRSVEVYRAQGLTLLIEGGKVVRALHSSSGKRGYETPRGTYAVFRKERMSWSVPYQVWLPYASYFNGGIAFHAYPQIPVHPASHGCIRLPHGEAPFAYAFMSPGTRVTVH